MKLVRAVTLVLSILALAGLLVALAVAPAGANPKASFKPKVGSYAGTVSIEGAKAPVLGQVAKEGKKYIVQVLGSTTETCDNGVTYPAGFGLPVTFTGKSFSLEEEGSDSYTGGTATWKINGHFISEKEFTGSASRTSVGSTKDTTIHSCKMKNVKFTLKWKTSKPLGAES
jgi:hypothetical protein